LPGKAWLPLVSKTDFSNVLENYGGCQGFEQLLIPYSPVRLPV
jgi:hypothetical protein